MMTSPADDLAGSLQRFGLQRDRMRAALARRAGISGTDLDALEHLEADGPLTQRDLGERLSLTSGAVTMLVDRLEQAGWVHRRPHPGDRRYGLIELSPLAAASAPEGLAAYHARVRALAAGVPAGQRQAVAAFLAAAADAAAGAAAGLSAGRRGQPDVSQASRLAAEIRFVHAASVRGNRRRGQSPWSPVWPGSGAGSWYPVTAWCVPAGGTGRARRYADAPLTRPGAIRRPSAAASAFGEWATSPLAAPAGPGAGPQRRLPAAARRPAGPAGHRVL
jgi:DNA-binding MarR family transcriptional regulator